MLRSFVTLALVACTLSPALSVDTVVAGIDLKDVAASRVLPIRNVHGTITDEYIASVYVKAGTIPLTITATNLTFAPQTVTFRMHGARIKKPDGTYHALSVSPGILGPATIPEEGFITMGTVTLGGLPDFVVAGDLELKYSLNNAPSSYLKKSRVYVVDKRPERHMATPWIEVLEDACLWAFGTKDEACVVALTKEFFRSSKFFYFPVGNPRWINITDEHADEGKFDLTAMLNDGGPLSGECRDLSAYLLLCINALGHLANLEVAWAGTDALAMVQQFHTNDANWMGGAEAYDQDTHFFFHQVVRYSNGVSNGVYDPCIAQESDPAGNDYYAAPAGWAEDGYWQSGGGYWGLVNRLCSSSQSPSPCPKFFIPATVGVYPGFDGTPLLRGVF